MSEQVHTARAMLSSTANPAPGVAGPGTITIPANSASETTAPAVQVLTPTATKATDIVKIAGLGSLVQGVRDQISWLRTELPALGQSIQDLRASVTAVKAQVDAVHDDLKFEATTLGNGSGD